MHTTRNKITLKTHNCNKFSLRAAAATERREIFLREARKFNCPQTNKKKKKRERERSQKKRVTLALFDPPLGFSSPATN
jgi:hypothetical protein